MAKVVVVGSINMDLVVRAPRFPVAGETILGRTFTPIPGGKGANQAIAARRLGAEVTMIGRVGGDAFGSLLRDHLAAAGIRTDWLARDPDRATGVALITVADHGENTIVVVAGANAAVTQADLAAAGAVLAEAAVLLLQLEIPLEVVEAAAAAAAAGGVLVILNAAPARSLPAALLARVDYLVVNEVEAQQLAGGGAARPEDAARALQRLGARNVVVTLGAAGALLVGQDGVAIRAAGFPVEPVDTTAAGDGFMGAFGVALAEGRPAAEALRWGNAAGALAVTRAGAQPSLATRAEVEAFLRRPGEEQPQ